MLNKLKESLKSRAQECLKIVMNMSIGIILKLVYRYHGKLTFKYVKGGAKLVETDFTIRDEKVIKSIKQLKL